MPVSKEIEITKGEIVEQISARGIVFLALLNSLKPQNGIIIPKNGTSKALLVPVEEIRRVLQQETESKKAA